MIEDKWKAEKRSEPSVGFVVSIVFIALAIRPTDRGRRSKRFELIGPVNPGDNADSARIAQLFAR